MGARVAQNQGADLFRLGSNLLLKGSEYSAKYNLNESVSYDPDWARCEAVLVNGPWKEISEQNRGVSASRPVWDIIYYEYVVKRKQKAPWTTKAHQAMGDTGAGHVSGNDHTSWGNLVWAY